MLITNPALVLIVFATFLLAPGISDSRPWCELAGGTSSDPCRPSGAGSTPSNSQPSAPSTSAPSSSHDSSRAMRNAATGAALGAVVEMFLQGLGEEPENLMDQATQDEMRRTHDRLVKQEELRINKEKLEQIRLQAQASAKSDPSLDPWSSKVSALGGASSSGAAGASSGPPSGSMPPSGTLVAIKDPARNYEGEGCSYFTVPADEANLYRYADGSVVLYGDRVYECKQGLWKFKYPASIYTEKERTKFDAALREKSVRRD